MQLQNLYLDEVNRTKISTKLHSGIGVCQEEFQSSLPFFSFTNKLTAITC